MSSVVAIGGEPLSGYALAGVAVIPAADPASVRAAWGGLPTDVGLVLLTPPARAALDEVIQDRDVLWIVLPD
jgi:hypothetical protein